MKTHRSVDLLLAGAVAMVGLCCAAGTTYAAAGGYGPSPVVPSGVPGGYRAVVAAHTLGQAGGEFHIRADGGIVGYRVGKGAFGSAVQVVLTRANPTVIHKGLHGFFYRSRVVFAIGVLPEHNGTALHARKPIATFFTDARIGKGDIVAIFDGKHFTRVRSSVTGHTVHVDLYGPTEFIVLEPPRA